MKTPETKPSFIIITPIGLIFLFFSILLSVIGLYFNILISALWAAICFFFVVTGFISVISLALINHSKIRSLKLSIAPRELYEDSVIEFQLSDEHLFLVPYIDFRYVPLLKTQDGRSIDITLSPTSPSLSIKAHGRGTYSGRFDLLLIQDCLGFFKLSIPLYTDHSHRLIVLPSIGEKYSPIQTHSGGDFFHLKNTRKYSDIYTEHRHYMPGDDPRRINWKLYSHSGELFIRDEERSSPPSAQTLFIIDSHFDTSIFTISTARCLIDKMCSFALKSMHVLNERGFTIRFACSGSSTQNGDFNSAARFFSRIAAIPFEEGQTLVETTQYDKNIYIFAIPRAITKMATLDFFINSNSTNCNFNIYFFYPHKETSVPKSNFKNYFIFENKAPELAIFPEISAVIDSNINHFSSQGNVHVEHIIS